MCSFLLMPACATMNSVETLTAAVKLFVCTKKYCWMNSLNILTANQKQVHLNGCFKHKLNCSVENLELPPKSTATLTLVFPSAPSLCLITASFQVTLRADDPCRYVAWKRKKLYLLFAKHRYIAKIFALIVRNDIAEKLYSLNDKAFNESGHRYDLRLPSYCHMPGPELEKADVLQVPVQSGRTA